MQMTGGGVLELRREGNRVRFTAERQRDEAGLYKVWLTGGGGELMLGTLIPEGRTLRLGRSISLQELEQAGCWPVEGAEVRLVVPFGQQKNDGWTVISTLPASIPDTLLRRSLRGRLLVRQGEGGSCLLAAPFGRERPVALEPVFCLARPEKLRGEDCLVWAFDGQGQPVLPASEPAKMKEKY